MKRNALLVGIDIYQYANPLNGCSNDVEQLEKLLRRNGDRKRNFDVSTLVVDSIGESLNKESLLEKCKTLFAINCETTLFYFAGHGTVNESGGFLCTSESNEEALGLEMNELLSIVNESPAANKIVILDCCHSGAIADRKKINQVVELSNGVTIITSSRSEQYAKEVNGHGVFSQLLIEALKGEAADLLGNISPASIYNHIDRALSWDEQRPLFKTNISQSVSLRTVPPPISLDNLHQITELFSYPDSCFELDPSFEPDISIPDPSHVSNPENVKKYRTLQQLNRVNLVVPTVAHMYDAAAQSKGCELTPLGRYFWKLIKQDHI